MGYSIIVSLNGDYIRLDYSDTFQTVTSLVLFYAQSGETHSPIFNCFTIWAENTLSKLLYTEMQLF